jgi:uncharacterized protein with von Willebrand factor type A (vWA) domain
MPLQGGAALIGDEASGDHLAENVMHFARVLRAAGLRVTSERIALSLRALQFGGLTRREDFKATLATCMVDRPEHITMFDQAFYVFWRDPDLMGRIMAMLLPQAESRATIPPPPENRRLAAALFAPAESRSPQPQNEEIEVDATLTFSEEELLRKADFETMSDEEWNAAKRMMAKIAQALERQNTRRLKRAARGRTLDLPGSMKAGLRNADAMILRYRAPRTVPMPLLVLADISGSMSKYSRMLLHFTHALSMAGQKVESFVFGTRLSAITRALRRRDADEAVAAVVRQVEDWSGGTRITACLHDFNRDWSRRVLAHNATVLLITDGLEHGEVEQLRHEVERLAKSCRRLIWLNPLLRYQAFEARAAGIKAILPYVDLFLPAHNLDSLDALSQMLAGALQANGRNVSHMRR